MTDYVTLTTYASLVSTTDTYADILAERGCFSNAHNLTKLIA